MARTCAVTGKQSQVGGKYSNRVRATQFNPTGTRRRKVNLLKRRVFIPELGEYRTFMLSTKALKTLNKKGAYAVLREAGLV